MNQTSAVPIAHLVELAENARIELERALSSLDRARSWSIFDMLGGGFISGIIKHNRMDEAAEHVESAREYIECLQYAYQQTQLAADLHLDIGDFARFADIFFDGLFADVYMHSKINEYKGKIESALRQLNQMIRHLNQAMHDPSQR
ncbi:hypothetical protein LJC33_06275 [Eubacteriales bacterium OttesenSCG-928-N13]|nr:hypothetical protein [Eubacteriales bacterium OttesenSCG-928-N13]